VILALVAAVAALAAPPAPGAPPPPGAPLPSAPGPTAQQLATTTRALETAVERWQSSGRPESPRALRLWALHQQRLYLALGLASRRHGDAVVKRLPRPLRPNARDVLAARRALVRLTRRRRCRSRHFAPAPQSRPAGCSATTGRRSGASRSRGTSSRP
jgi:hypothetical protein